MYCHHFGFDKPPFKITPDPELFFPGGNRGAVLDALIYAISRGEGIVKVVGEVGSGKTMLCRMLEREIPAQCEVIYLANPTLGPEEILPAIAAELGLAVPPGARKPAVLHLLHDYLLAKHADNRRVVMFVEEAQCMPLSTLEEIRLLSNLETAQDKLLQIVLFGQPELDIKLARHEIRQLNERITYRFHLQPFNHREVRDYLNTRLQASGYRGPELFTSFALRALTRYSRGLLRRINVLADKALLAAYSGGVARIRSHHVRLAARDSEFSGAGGERALAWRGFAGAALTAVLVATVLMPTPRSWRSEAGASPRGTPLTAVPGSSALEDAEDDALTDFPLALGATSAPGFALVPTRGSDPLLRAFSDLERLMPPADGVLWLGEETIPRAH